MNWTIIERKEKAVDCFCLDKKMLIFLSDLDVYILLKSKWESNSAEIANDVLTVFPFFLLLIDFCVFF